MKHLKTNKMKKLTTGVLVLIMFFSLSSCQAIKRMFQPKEKAVGCQPSGKAVGAEKLASGDPKAEKQAKKAGKFKYDTMY
jgi:hypothetical protein